MKVLIVSHNAISETSNMGKTLRACFRDFACEEIAQFYIHSEAPSDASVCRNYYRFTDVDAIKSLLPFQTYGTIFEEPDIRTERTAVPTDAALLRSVYQYGRRRTAAVYALRNTLWKRSRWDRPQLWKWVEDFGPDVVFFASGDYGFLYDIARQIAEHAGKPLAVACMDDFYLYNRNEGRLLGRIVHRSFLKTVHKTMAYASAVFTICPSMQKEYEALFGKQCCVLPTPAEQWESPESLERSGVAYLGNLGLQRNRQLAAIGRTLRGMDAPGLPKFVDVYSGERNPEILKVLTEENGIRFHGAVSAEEVRQILQRSAAVIHTESFDPEIRKRIRFSISTKIPETLMNGPCLIAYGPEGAASIDYVKENGAAYTITQPQQLEQGLREILTDAALRNRIVGRARALAKANHSMQANSANLRKSLAEICGQTAKTSSGPGGKWEQ